MTVFERIKILAKEHGMSLNELNQKANLGERTIYRWKTRRPSDANLEKVAKVLHTSVNYLRYGTVKADGHSKKLDKADEAMLTMFRKSTAGMSEDEKLKFQKSLTKLMNAAKDLNN